MNLQRLRGIVLALAFGIPIFAIITVYNGWQADRNACELTRNLTQALNLAERECGAITGDHIFPVLLAVVVGAALGAWGYSMKDPDAPS